MPRDGRWRQGLEDEYGHDDHYYDEEIYCSCEHCCPAAEDMQVTATAVQELEEAVRPTTMAQALSRAGVIDDVVE